jgi:phosphopantetheinyl transferase
MPIILSETPKPNVIWGLWQITETETELRKRTLFSEADEAYLKTLTNPARRLQTLSCRALLQQLLHMYNVPYKGIMKDVETGKPYLIDCGWHVSFSHSRAISSAIVHRNAPVGIDIELLQEKLQRIQTKFLSEEEMAWADNKVDRLGMLWSAKEAIYKQLSAKGVTLKGILMQPLEQVGSNLKMKGFAKLGDCVLEIDTNSVKIRNHVLSYCC